MAEKDDDLLKEARERFKEGIEWESDNRENWVDDTQFLHGDQWPEGVKRERELSGRPCLTRNRLPSFVGTLISDARQNSPTIQVHPIDDGSDPKLAEIYEGLIRQIETQSHADQAYDNALEQSAGGGIGAFRILTRYSDDDSFDQDIYIQRITNPLTIVVDPQANEYDKSDAKWMFVSEMLTEKEFERRWPDANKVGWESTGRGDDFQYWRENGNVRIAEYWVKNPVKKRIGLLESGETIELTDRPLPPDMQVMRQRVVDSHKVVRYVLAGNQILEGPQDWPGKYIPIVMVYGPEVFIEGKVYYRSVHRYAKDAQKMYNYWSTTIAEKLTLAPKSPYIGTVEMFEGLEREWGAANTENRAYLPYNVDPMAPGMKPQRERPADVNAGEIQASQQCVDDMKATMGIFDASLGAQGNETSGRAILARQQEGDSATFPWLDNLARSIEYAGRILVDLIPKIYDSERVIRVLGIDDEEEFVPINRVIRDPNTDEIVTYNDLSLGKYDVTVTTGPSYKTQRLEAADSLLQFIQAVPAAGAVTADLIAKNMDWPGAQELTKRLKKLLPPGMLDPDDPDAPQQPQGPDPMQLMQMRLAFMNQQAEIDKKMADAEKSRASAAQTMADIGKTGAEAEGQELDNAQKTFELAAATGGLDALINARVRDALFAILGPPPQQPQIPQEPGQAPGFFVQQ